MTPDDTTSGRHEPAAGPVTELVQGGVLRRIDTGGRWYDWPSRVLSWAGMAAVAVMLVHVIAEVAFRGFFNHPLPGTLDYITYWYLAAIAFIGMWQAFVNNEHISVDLVTARLKPGAQWVLYIFGGIVTLVLLAMVFWFGLETAIAAFEKGEFIGSDRVPIWPMRFLVPLGIGAYMIALVAQLIGVARAGDLSSLEDHHEPV